MKQLIYSLIVLQSRELFFLPSIPWTSAPLGVRRWENTSTAAAAAAEQPRKNKSTSLISPRRKMFRKDLPPPSLVIVQNFKSAHEQGTSACLAFSKTAGFGFCSTKRLLTLKALHRSSGLWLDQTKWKIRLVITQHFVVGQCVLNALVQEHKLESWNVTGWNKITKMKISCFSN